MTTLSAAELIRCAGCAAEKKTKATAKGLLRVPMGWKRHNAQTWCAKCWAERYVLRAVTFPVAGPVGADWPAFREALNSAWSMTTAASNYITSELYAADVRREPGAEKLLAQPKTYLYPQIRARFPDLPSQSVASLERAVAGKYRAKRYEVLWTCAASLPNHRYPTPAIAPSQGWRAHYGEDNVPLVDVTLPGGRFTLRLRGGNEFRRQLTAFRQMVEGTAVCGELAFYRQRANGSDHRNGVEARTEAGAKVSWCVMCKLVAWLPRPKQNGEQTGTLFVRTDKDSLLVALDAKDERLWIHHADHIRRWEAEHRRRLNRWSDDQKAEQRPDATFAARREAAVLKYRRRMKSAIQEAVAQLANFARRRHFAAVRYDDREQNFCGRFPWFELRTRLAVKLDEYGIALELASAEVAQPEPGAARG